MRIITTIIFNLLCLILQAQKHNCATYETAMKNGHKFFDKKKYDSALIEFQAAQIAARECGKNTNDPAQEVKKVFDQLESQRTEAVKAKKAAIDASNETIRALSIANNEKKRADSNLATAKKLINAFYFYDGRFALALKDIYGNERYGFINRQGDVVIDYKYVKAEQFDYTGYSKVKNYDDDGVIVDCLIDTSGKEFRVAYNITDLNSEITALDLRGQYPDSIPLSVFSQMQLKLLFLEGYHSASPYRSRGRRKIRGITKLPIEIRQLKNLEILNLDYNLLEALPPDIRELKNLHTLNLMHNQLTALPQEIGQLTNLQTLNLNANPQLTFLPSEIGQLKNLRTLNAELAQLVVLPPEIGQLENLHTLDLGNNQLKILPSEIGKLKNLKTLDVSKNLLTRLPAEIGQLENLQTLDLRGNNYQLNSLPSEIELLKNLQTLNISSCGFSVFPTKIGLLKKLQILDLSYNLLKAFPPAIGQLKNLRILDLSSNSLKVLPPVIGQLNNLEMLDLSSDSLSTLPAELGQLNKLETLDLSYNLLEELPVCITQLKALQSFNLSANKLKKFPGEIGQLLNLSTLDLRGNPDLKSALPALRALLPNCVILF